MQQCNNLGWVRGRGDRMSWREYVRHVIGDDRQVDVSTKTGIDQGTISRWLRDENGDGRARVSSQAVRAFAHGYGVPVLEAFVVAGLLSEDESGVSPPRRHHLQDVSDAELLAELRRRLGRDADR